MTLETGASLEHRLHFLFGSAFQIMNMHRDLSTYNGDQTHTYAIVPIAYASSEGAYRYY